MKYLSVAVLALLAVSSTTSATTLEQKALGDDIWGETLEAGLDASTYLKDSPKGYTEKVAPKPDPKIAIKKKQAQVAA